MANDQVLPQSDADNPYAPPRRDAVANRSAVAKPGRRLTDGFEALFGQPGLQLVVIAALIGAAAWSRLIEHPWNFTPIGAMALFAGAKIRDWRLALAIPLAAMALSDAALGFSWILLYVYVSFAMIVGLGMLLGRLRSPLWIAVFPFASGTLFYLVTNFGCWASFDMYPRTLGGLLACYEAGIPFFRNTLAGDLFYTFVLFGSFALLRVAAGAWRTRRAVA